MTDSSEFITRLCVAGNGGWKLNFVYADCLRSDRPEALALGLKRGLHRGTVVFTGRGAGSERRVVALVALAKRLGFEKCNLELIGVDEATVELLPLLSKAKLDSLSIALLAPSAHLHDQLCGKPKDFDHATNLIAKASNLGIEVLVRIFLLEPVLNPLQETLRLSARLGAQRVQLVYPKAPRATADELLLFPSRNTLANALQNLFEAKPPIEFTVENLPEDLLLRFAHRPEVQRPETSTIERELALLFQEGGGSPVCLDETRCNLCSLESFCRRIRKTEERIRTHTESTNIVLTSDCRNNCVFCTFKNMDPPGSKYPHTPIEDLERQMRKGRELGSTKLVFVGTEPLEYKNLPEIVQLGSSMGFTEIVLQTHAEDFEDPRLVSALEHAGLTEVRAGIYGPTPEVHDAITRTTGSFERLIRAIKNLQKSSIRVVLHTTVCRQNLQHLLKTALFAQKLGPGLSEYKLVAPFTKDLAWYKQVVPKYTEVLEAAAEQYSNARGNEKRVAEEMLLRLSNNTIPQCVIIRVAQKTHVPLKPSYRTEPLGDDLTSLQFSLKHILPDGSISPDLFTHSRHDIKTTIVCPYRSECAFGTSCPGIYLEYARAYGLSEFQPVSEALAKEFVR